MFYKSCDFSILSWTHVDLSMFPAVSHCPEIHKSDSVSYSRRILLISHAVVFVSMPFAFVSPYFAVIFNISVSIHLA